MNSPEEPNLNNLKDELNTILDQYKGYDPTRSRFYNIGKFICGHGEIGYNRKINLRIIMEQASTIEELLLKVGMYYIKCFEENRSRSCNSNLLKNIADFLQNKLHISHREVCSLSPAKPIVFSFDGTTTISAELDLITGFLLALNKKIKLMQNMLPKDNWHTMTQQSAGSL